MANETIKKSVLICIPSFDQKIHLETISSIISVRDTLIGANIGCGMMWVRDSLVTRARNKLVASFLSQKEYTHLFFIDADIVFTPDQFIRVLLFDKPITAGPYPIKSEHKIEDGDASFGWCINFELGTYDLKDNDKGFKKVNYAGTGFMCIERKVFDTIIEKYPEIEYQSDVRTKIDGKIEKPVGIKEYAFFDTGIQGKGILKDEENTQRYLSEDFFFCQLWKQCGGEIWADLTSEMKHIGIKTYERLPIIKLKKKDDS
jgi:hypothetical protein